jgi:hypothetical protein
MFAVHSRATILVAGRPLHIHEQHPNSSTNENANRSSSRSAAFAHSLLKPLETRGIFLESDGEVFLESEE